MVGLSRPLHGVRGMPSRHYRSVALLHGRRVIHYLPMSSDIDDGRVSAVDFDYGTTLRIVRVRAVSPRQSNAMK